VNVKVSAFVGMPVNLLLIQNKRERITDSFFYSMVAMFVGKARQDRSNNPERDKAELHPNTALCCKQKEVKT
jgi:hypothetical protein